MTRAALDILGQNEKGFFLMVESGNIDRQSHFADINDIFIGSVLGPQFSSISIIIQEVIEFSNAVQVAVDWVRSRDNGDDDDEDDDDDAFDDTLILVTADHETAGLVVTADNGPGQLPDVEYTASFFDIGPDIGVPFPVLFFNHTGDNIPIYAIGKNALVFGTDPEFGRPLLDNTEILDRLLISKSNFRARE